MNVCKSSLTITNYSAFSVGCYGPGTVFLYNAICLLIAYSLVPFRKLISSIILQVFIFSLFNKVLVFTDTEMIPQALLLMASSVH